MNQHSPGRPASDLPEPVIFATDWVALIGRWVGARPANPHPACVYHFEWEHGRFQTRAAALKRSLIQSTNARTDDDRWRFFGYSTDNGTDAAA